MVRNKKKNCSRKPFNIVWPSTIKLLGVHVGYDVKVMEEKTITYITWSPVSMAIN